MAWCLDHSGDFDGRQLAVVVFRVFYVCCFCFVTEVQRCQGTRKKAWKCARINRGHSDINLHFSMTIQRGAGHGMRAMAHLKNGWKHFCNFTLHNFDVSVGNMRMPGISLKLHTDLCAVIVVGFFVRLHVELHFCTFQCIPVYRYCAFCHVYICM